MVSVVIPRSESDEEATVEAKMRPFMQIGVAITLGALAALAVAVIVGRGAAWLTVGIAIGIALGSASARRHSATVNDQRRTTNH